MYLEKLAKFPKKLPFVMFAGRLFETPGERYIGINEEGEREVEEEKIVRGRGRKDSERQTERKEREGERE